MNFSPDYLKETALIAESIDVADIEKIINILLHVRNDSGRLFFLGMGGSASNCSHAVNDFRKIAEIEAYAPTDNVSEFSARVNDDGLGSSFALWLEGSRLQRKDCVFVMSVGGGDPVRQVSSNIVHAIDFAKSVGASVVGIVGRDGGYTAKKADACVIIPSVNPDTITPHTEAFQGVICHLIVSHPLIKAAHTKWESMDSMDSLETKPLNG